MRNGTAANKSCEFVSVVIGEGSRLDDLSAMQGVGGCGDLPLVNVQRRLVQAQQLLA